MSMQEIEKEVAIQLLSLEIRIFSLTGSHRRIEKNKKFRNEFLFGFVMGSLKMKPN